MKTCVLTIIKNEHLYLEEWIKYHLNIGINHIFVFEDINSDTHSQITNKYPEVTLHNSYLYNDKGIQVTNLIIPNGVKIISGYAFYNCVDLINITIGTEVTHIHQQAFKLCRNLTSITILATTPPVLGDEVFNSTNNCPIYVPNNSVNAYKSADKWSNYASRIQAIPND